MIDQFTTIFAEDIMRGLAILNDLQILFAGFHACEVVSCLLEILYSIV
jgi:hypothetical protein